jgi:hypothetical protein
MPLARTKRAPTLSARRGTDRAASSLHDEVDELVGHDDDLDDLAVEVAGHVRVARAAASIVSASAPAGTVTRPRTLPLTWTTTSTSSSTSSEVSAVGQAWSWTEPA